MFQADETVCAETQRRKLVGVLKKQGGQHELVAGEPGKLPEVGLIRFYRPKIGLGILLGIKIGNHWKVLRRARM